MENDDIPLKLDFKELLRVDIKDSPTTHKTAIIWMCPVCGAGVTDRQLHMNYHLEKLEVKFEHFTG